MVCRCESARIRIPRHPGPGSVVSSHTTVACPLRWVEQADRLAASHLQGEVVDRGEAAVAVGQVPAVDRRWHCHRCLSCGMRVMSSRTADPRSRLSSWSASGSSSTVASAARRAARGSSAMRCAGLVAAAGPPCGRGVVGADQQAVGRQLGHQCRGRLGPPQLGGCLPHRDTRFAAHQPQRLPLRLGQASASDPRPVDLRSGAGTVPPR